MTAALDLADAYYGYRQSTDAELSEHETDSWQAEVTVIVGGGICPALASYGDRLRQVTELGRSDEAAGFCHLHGGEALYRDLVWASTSVDRSPEEIHSIGLAQIERLADEMGLYGSELGRVE